jgi:hypothetical protein
MCSFGLLSSLTILFYDRSLLPANETNCLKSWGFMCVQFMQFFTNQSLFHIATRLWVGGVWFLAGAKIFLFATVSRLALGPTQSSQWVPGAILPGIKCPMAWSWQHSWNLMPRLRMHGAIPPLCVMWFVINHTLFHKFYMIHKTPQHKKLNIMLTKICLYK